MSDVKVLARWNGWCDPCDIDRPLLLAEHGPRGVGAWLHGVGLEDRTLHLTCGVCGQWQLVPQLEEDDPLTDAERAEIEKTLRAEQDRLAAEAELEALTPAVVRRPLFGRRRAAAETVAEETTELEDITAEAEETVERPSRFSIRRPAAVVTDEDEIVAAAAEVVEAEEKVEEKVERPSRFSFRRPAAVVTDEELAEFDDVEAVVLAEDVVPARRSLFAGLRRTPKIEVETEDEDEDEIVAEDAEPEVPRSIAPDDEDEPLVRWAAVQERYAETPAPAAVPAIVSTALVPSRTERPSPVDIPTPRAAKPAVVVPVPRTAPSPVRSISATDTALLTLLGEGLDVVSAGRR